MSDVNRIVFGNGMSSGVPSTKEQRTVHVTRCCGKTCGIKQESIDSSSSSLLCYRIFSHFLLEAGNGLRKNSPSNSILLKITHYKTEFDESFWIFSQGRRGVKQAKKWVPI
jgi:hypothetical protein